MSSVLLFAGGLTSSVPTGARDLGFGIRDSPTRDSGLGFGIRTPREIRRSDLRARRIPNPKPRIPSCTGVLVLRAMVQTTTPARQQLPRTLGLWSSVALVIG